MNKWFYINFLVLCLGVYKIVTSSLHPYTIFGAIGLFLILMNWTRHAVFSTLRSSLPRKKKKKYANLSKKILPFHRWIGSTAFLVILIHGYLSLQHFGIYLRSFKSASGLLATIILASVVTTGWMRLYRPSGRKRMAHLWLGLTMFFLIVLHLIL